MPTERRSSKETGPAQQGSLWRVLIGLLSIAGETAPRDRSRERGRAEGGTHRGRGKAASSESSQMTLFADRARVGGRTRARKPSPRAKPSAVTPTGSASPRLISAKPPAPTAGAKRGRMAGVYEQMVDELLERYGVRVRKWRTSMSGIAILRKDKVGRWMLREIESPYPRGPVSAAVFCHEIGHHAIGVGSMKPRCLEEWAAWDFAVREMERRGIPVTDRVRERVDLSLRYAVAKAKRRGLKRVPAELAPYERPVALVVRTVRGDSASSRAQRPA
jgi:hypothetical protein